MKLSILFSQRHLAEYRPGLVRDPDQQRQRVFFLISINQIDLCHTSSISSKGWFIHLFELKFEIVLKKSRKKKVVKKLKANHI